MIQVDVTIIGGGMVGCATAAAVAKRGYSTVLLEKETKLATGVTARNSEVAHGGMYYPVGSLKAMYCVQGRRLLKDFCAQAGVAYQEYGKLIVAVTPEQEPALQELLELGKQNDVEDLRLLGHDELSTLEPNLRGVAALFSPRTAVLDAEGATRAYAHLAQERSAQVLTGAQVTGLARENDSWRVEVSDSGREGWTHASRWIVNAAGLYADDIAALAGLDVAALGLQQTWVKGNYFSVAARHAGQVRHLIYPVPPADGSTLGVHVCIDLGGQMRLGPDMEPIPRREDYRVDPARRERFFASASMFLPFLAKEDLEPNMAGIRPKLDADKFADFVVRKEEADRQGLINLIGIDSPGLTSGPALAEAVADLIQE
jgi:L-2-hydroxyglutarate oxidase LhgO